MKERVNLFKILVYLFRSGKTAIFVWPVMRGSSKYRQVGVLTTFVLVIYVF